MEILRKLASIRRIINIQPIEGADKIETATVDGWKVVVQKGKHTINELVLYCEIDSFLPVRPEFEFLRKGCFKSTKNLGDGFRLRTIKLKGQISQGLILPLTEFTEITTGEEDDGTCWILWDKRDGVSSPVYLNEGDDLTDLLKVQKYEKPIPSNLQGQVRGNFPSFIPKTDQERYQNLRDWQLEEYSREPFEVTVKMDGSSMTVYKNGEDFGVCSRNLDLKDDAENNFREEGSSENIYWKVARKLGLKEYFEEFGLNIALQGELCGPGIQGNPQNLPDHEFFVFDIYDIDNQRYYSPMERFVFISNAILDGVMLNHVQIRMVGVFNDYLMDATYIHGLADAADFRGFPAEGLVFKSNDGKFSFKMISDLYLLNEKD